MVLDALASLRRARPIAQLARDLRAVVGGLAGERAAPFTERRPRPAVATPVVAPRLGGRALAGVERRANTAEAVTLVLRDPQGAPIDFVPGQFFTLRVEVDGVEVRRAYSAAGSALVRDRLELTIKRVPGGRASGFLVERVGAGDRIDVLGPSGAFVVAPEVGARRRLVLVAGGSGITPMMAILRTILAVETGTEIALIDGNRSVGSILYADELAALAAEFAGRLFVRHVVEEAPAGWQGGVGRLVGEALAAELAALPWGLGAVSGFYLCGPEPMLAAARELLVGRGVAAGSIHEERFTRPHEREAAAQAREAVTVTIRQGGVERAVSAAPGTTILEAGLAAGARMPFSCAMGGCGACKVRLVAGEAAMEEPNCLGAGERAAGEILACVAAPLSPCTVEVR